MNIPQTISDALKTALGDCRCHEMYTSRKKIDPDCAFHNWHEELFAHLEPLFPPIPDNIQQWILDEAERISENGLTPNIGKGDNWQQAFFNDGYIAGWEAGATSIAKLYQSKLREQEERIKALEYFLEEIAQPRCGELMGDWIARMQRKAKDLMKKEPNDKPSVASKAQ